MNPKERILNAMRMRPVDYLPCSVYFNDNLELPGYDLTRQTERNRLGLDLGTDPVAILELGYHTHPEVKVETWRDDNPPDCDYPVLWQRWKTPEGELTQAVKLTPEISHWTSIVWDDFATSNIYKPLLEKSRDVDLVPYIYSPAPDEKIPEIERMNREVMEQAKAENLPVMTTYGQGLAVAMFMMGAENLLYFSIDYPEAFRKFADYIHQTEMTRIETAKKLGVDILKRFGGYETTNFYSPDTFREVVAPKLRLEAEKAHELDMLIFYRVVTGMEPILDDIAGIGLDCIEGGEPHLSKCSLEQWRDAFAGKASSWTGISTPALIGKGTPGQVREEVRHAVEVFGKQGFILGVTNSIRNHFPWENTLAMIDEWKKIH